MARPARTPDSAFWVDRADVDAAAGRLRLSASESRHLLRVFRAAPGASFEAVDGQGFLYHCVLDADENGIAVGRIESRVPNAGELPGRIELIVGLPDLAQTETIVAQAVALGVSKIDFASAERSGFGPLSESRLDRLSRIARSALKQSRRSCLPFLGSSRGLPEALAGITGNYRWVADVAGVSSPEVLPSSVRQLSQINAILAVGPPGGFTAEESALLRDRQFEPISLGPSRLTTSTAALVLLAVTRNRLFPIGLDRVDKNGTSGYLH